jgi:glycosyltransferase involved in cell wall biosynthesis
MIQFSVVIATYRRKTYALEAIRSVVEQTFPPQEIILVVDGSDDGTASAVRETYPTVRVLEQSNLGPSVAHNSGIAAAVCDWVCFLDDDDLWHREKLEITAKFIFDHPECQAVRNPVWFFCDQLDGPEAGFGFHRDFVATTLDECHEAISQGDYSPNSFDYLEMHGDSFRLLLERNRGVLSSSVVLRETLIRAGGFCPMQTCGDDWTMFVNVARLCEWYTVPQRLGFTRLHSAQNTVDPWNGLYTLVGMANAWLTGSPLKCRVEIEAALQELAQFGPVYRQAIQGYFWGAIRSGNLRLARMIRANAQLLLPKTCDFLYVHVPPQITWRWERYFLGMHR